MAVVLAQEQAEGLHACAGEQLDGMMSPSFLDRKELMADSENDDIEPDATAPGADGRTRLMQEVAEQMDAIESDLGRDYEIGRVITIVEVKTPDGEVGLRVRAGQYPWVSLGMLEFAKKSIEAQMAG